MKRFLLVGMDPKAMAIIASVTGFDNAMEVKNLMDIPVAIGNKEGHVVVLDHIDFRGGQVVGCFRDGTLTDPAVIASTRFFRGE